jgi:hypothetical protein
VAADMPFQSMMYDKAELHKENADEFIIYREIVMNFTRLIYYFSLAAIFYFIQDIRIGFVFAAIASIGFFFMNTESIKILKNGFRSLNLFKAK